MSGTGKLSNVVSGSERDRQAEINAAKIAELRHRTGLGIMVCKKALVEAGGDIDDALDLLRVRGKVAAGKRAHKKTSEGIVLIRADLETGMHSMVEVDCETDFVAKSDEFYAFAESVAETVLMYKPSDLNALEACLFSDINFQPPRPSRLTVEEARCAVADKVRENVVIRRFALAQGMDAEYSRIEGYLHHNRIGVLVDIQGGAEPLGREIAMHICWAEPLYLSMGDVPAGIIAKERDILTRQAEQEAKESDQPKPPDIVGKMVEGRLKKFYQKNVLLEQIYARDETVTVGQFLRRKGARVVAMWRFALDRGTDPSALHNGAPADKS